jgi:N-acetylmuramoyl-L-alanine amidase
MPTRVTYLGHATVAGVSSLTRSPAARRAISAARVWLAPLAIATLVLVLSPAPAVPAVPAVPAAPAAPAPAEPTAALARAEPTAALARAATAFRQALAGRVIGIDPGHNGRNWSDPAFLAHQIWNGRELENCDTTGTSTDAGYTEAEFNFNVARYLRGDLLAEGARVVMTRPSNAGVGPCVTTRARIIDSARADVAIDIHADGGPPSGRGFAILLPVADGVNSRVIAASERFGEILRGRFQAVTRMPLSTYDGVHGLTFRDDLAGLNLTTVPKVLIECGNMRNASDAALLVTASFQQLAARAMAQAITAFLARH